MRQSHFVTRITKPRCIRYIHIPHCVCELNTLLKKNLMLAFSPQLIRCFAALIVFSSLDCPDSDKSYPHLPSSFFKTHCNVGH